jgi:hypothetical protein
MEMVGRRIALNAVEATEPERRRASLSRWRPCEHLDNISLNVT